MRPSLTFGAASLGLVLAGAAIGAGALRQAPKLDETAKARVELARRIYERTEEQLLNAPPPPAAAAETDRLFPLMEQLAAWSRRWMEAEQDLDPARGTRLAALEDHLKRVKAWEEQYRQLLAGGAASATQLSLDKLTYIRLEAEHELARFQGGG